MKVLKSKQHKMEACTNFSFIGLVKKIGGLLKTNSQKSQKSSKKVNLRFQQVSNICYL